MMEGGTVTGEVSPAVLLRCAVCVEQRASSVSRRCVMIRVTYYATHKCPQTHTIKTHVMTTHGGGASRVHFACVHLVATPILERVEGFVVTTDGILWGSPLPTWS